MLDTWKGFDGHWLLLTALEDLSMLTILQRKGGAQRYAMSVLSAWCPLMGVNRASPTKMSLELVTTYHFFYHFPVNQSKVWLPSSPSVEKGSPDPRLATPTTMSPMAISQESVLQALENRLLHCFFLQKMRNYTKSKWEIGTKSPAQGLRECSLSKPCCLPFKRDKKNVFNFESG